MYRKWLLLFMTAVAPCLAFPQSTPGPLDIFGYFQTSFDQSSERTSVMSMPENTTTRSTFILQQANIFFRKEFSPKFTSFVSLEFTKSFSSLRGWGTFRIEEGWAWYIPSEYFSVKAGLLVPAFNNLNEIKNRMPLLPYITRPVVYEAAAEGVINFDEFTPNVAFLQFQGTLPASDVRIDYAVYVGNGDPSFVAANDIRNRYLIGGIDTSSSKLFGGRVGARAGKFRAGFSLTSDKMNRSDIRLGAIPRRRIGVDFSFQIGAVSLESEFIATKEMIDDSQRKVFQFAAMMNPELGADLKNSFVYGLVNYDFSEMLFAYAGAEYMEYHLNSITRGYMAGGGIRPIDQIVVKLQYLHLENVFGNLSTYHADRFQAGVSVMF